MLTALSDLGTQQASATTNTSARFKHFLNYCATYPNSALRYIASDMILCVHSDTSYLTAPKARSRVGGHFYLGNVAFHTLINNGAVLNVATVLKNNMSSGAEAEIGGLFINSREAVPLRTTLQELGYPQPPTTIITANSTASGIVNDTIKQRRSKAIDMRFYWVKDRIAQQQFNVQWAPGISNLADYFTKYHPAVHHQAVRNYYVHEPTAPFITQLPSKLTANQVMLQGVLELQTIPNLIPYIPLTWLAQASPTNKPARSTVGRQFSPATGSSVARSHNLI